MGTLCNSEDPDGSPGSVLFAQKKSTILLFENYNL